MQNETMLAYFDRSQPSSRYWACFAVICAGFILDFYDFFIVGFLLAAVGPMWHLTYGESSLILLGGGVGAICGSLTCGTIADKFGRKPVVVCSAIICALASASIALIPDGSWQIFALIRVLVGFGLGGVATVQIALIAETTPATYRVKVSGFPIMGPGIGTLLAAFSTAALIGWLGWRGVAVVGLLPLLVAIAYIIVMPETPRWLVTKGRGEEARAAITKLLGVPLESVPMTMDKVVPKPKVSLTELYGKPGRFWLVIAIWTCMATCNYGVYLWGPTITAMLMHVSVAKAAKYFVYVSMVGIIGRAFFSILPNYIGRRLCGQLFGFMIAITFAAAAMFYESFVAGVSVFIVLLVINAFFNDGGFASISPYMSEIFPVRMAARGVGLAQASNGMGKILGPYCLAVIAGTGKTVSAAATQAAILPAFMFLASCGLVVGIVHLFFAPETLGRTLKLDDQEDEPKEIITGSVVG